MLKDYIRRVYILQNNDNMLDIINYFWDRNKHLKQI